MVKEITCITWGMYENVAKQLNKWIQNGHDINKSFIKIVHNGDFYVIFYDAKLDELVEDIVY